MIENQIKVFFDEFWEKFYLLFTNISRATNSTDPNQNYPPFNLGIYFTHCVKRFEQTLANTKLLKWLLDDFLTPEDINGTDNIGRNCLHYCVIQNKLVFFHLVFPYILPETIVGVDKYGLCCVHYAIFLNSYHTLEALAIRYVLQLQRIRTQNWSRLEFESRIDLNIFSAIIFQEPQRFGGSFPPISYGIKRKLSTGGSAQFCLFCHS